MTWRQSASASVKIILDTVSDIFYMTTNIHDIMSNGAVMPFREKTAWVSLITTVGIWGAYFWAISRFLLDRGSLASLPADSVGLFIAGVVAIVIVQIILAIVMAVVSGKASEASMDEREQLIDLKGARSGFYALNAAAFMVSMLWALGASPLVMANGILAAMVLGEVVRSGWIIVGYRRGR